jgi:hypothetical protein
MYLHGCLGLIAAANCKLAFLQKSEIKSSILFLFIFFPFLQWQQSKLFFCLQQDSLGDSDMVLQEVVK